jgi:hypothetical protein
VEVVWSWFEVDSEQNLSLTPTYPIFWHFFLVAQFAADVMDVCSCDTEFVNSRISSMGTAYLANGVVVIAHLVASSMLWLRRSIIKRYPERHL